MRENTSNSKRKTDRRTLMTRRIIRDALLDLLQTTPYTRITVTMLCRQAEITRATFVTGKIKVTNLCKQNSPILVTFTLPVTCRSFGLGGSAVSSPCAVASYACS